MKENTRGVKFKVFVQPRSSKNMIAGLHGDALKIRLTAPPVDNAANKMCIQFLSKSLQVSKSSIEIISGHTSRTKMVLLRYMDEKTPRTEKKRLKQLIVSLSAPLKTA
ncbi:DUF167 domain-containing protein [Thermodesulfobacteriota bacterium]